MSTGKRFAGFAVMLLAAAVLGATGSSALAGAPALASSSSAPTPPGNQPPPSGPIVRPAFQVPGHTAEMSYVPVAPCVLVDTRSAGGMFVSGAARSFDAGGTGSLAGQGGSATGCGLPTNAASMAINVSAVAPVHSGFIRLVAFGGPGTGTTAVNYSTGQSITGFTDLDLAAPGAARAFTVTNSGGPTHIVISVLGYYIAPLDADVFSDGTLRSGSRVVSEARLAVGVYQVVFDRDVTACYYTSNSFGPNASIELEPRSGQPDGVFVFIADNSGTAIDTEFYLSVSC